MRFIIITLFFLNSFLYASIDSSKYAVTIGLSTTLKQSKYIAKKLNKYDIYIYKTTETKKSYYVIYAVNIRKKNLNKTIKEIKLIYKDAYRTTKQRIITLKSNNFNNNIFINKTQINNIYLKDDKQIITKKNLNIDIDKRSLFIKYVKNKSELFRYIKTHREFDIFIENIKNTSLTDYTRCCAIYIVNLDLNSFIMLDMLVYKYANMKEVPSTSLRYINDQHNLSKFIQGKL